MARLFYRIFLYLNILAAFALLLSYASTWISPAKFWVLAFFGLGYPYLLGLNVIFLMYWIFRLNKRFLISLLAILLGINHMNDLIPIRFEHKESVENASSAKRQIRVLSYNVRLFNVYEWLSYRSDIQDILNYLKSEQADIICLQEFYSSNKKEYHPDRIRKSLSSTPYNFIHNSFSYGNKYSYGIATFSRYPIINQGTISFPKTSNETIFTDIVIESDTIRVYNNHLQSVKLQKRNYEFLDSFRLRYDDEQMRELRDIYHRLKSAYIKRSVQVRAISSHIASSPYPVIVCGDFNDTPVSYSYRVMKKGLKDAFISSGRGTGSTYRGIFPYFRIDYIFHDSYFKPLSFEKTEAKLSDHFPIQGVFRLDGKNP